MTNPAPEPTTLSLTDDQQAAIDAAVTAVRAGECIVLPTDTVYGIGADAFNPGAVAALLAAKSRGRDMPPPVLVADASVLMALGTDVGDRAKQLAEAHWPGALTIIVRAQPSLHMDLGETRGTVAVRVPDHDGTRALLRATGPLAVSSANRSGFPPATTVADAVEQLGDGVTVYLDAGASGSSTPSTIVDFTQTDYGQVLRRGALSIELLRETIPFLEDGTPEPEPEAEPEPETEPESETEPGAAGA